VIPAPLDPVLVKLKLLPVRHWLLLYVKPAVTGVLALIVVVAVTEQPLLSVTVTV
jgi:hypothetical protein